MNCFLLAVGLLSSSISDTTSVITDSSFNDKVNIEINITQQPSWGPIGYDHVEYYYMPSIETYYHVPKHQYIYFSNFRWLFSSVPPKYREADIYNCYKVVINESRPFLRFKEHQKAYSKFKGVKQQPIIRDAEDDKYKHHWNCASNKVQEKEKAIGKKGKMHKKWKT